MKDAELREACRQACVVIMDRCRLWWYGDEWAQRPLRAVNDLERFALHSANNVSGLDQRLAEVRESLVELAQRTGNTWNDEMDALQVVYHGIAKTVG